VKLLYRAAERLDELLDAVPRYEDGRWFRYGDWGCQLGLGCFWSKAYERR